MSPVTKGLFVAIIVFSTYHLTRDVMQMYGVENILTTTFHWKHSWCGAYCNQVSIPPEIAAIIGSLIVLYRGYVGLVGIVVLCFPPLLLLATLLLP